MTVSADPGEPSGAGGRPDYAGVLERLPVVIYVADTGGEGAWRPPWFPDAMARFRQRMETGSPRPAGPVGKACASALLTSGLTHPNSAFVFQFPA